MAAIPTVEFKELDMVVLSGADEGGENLVAIVVVTVLE